jgi:hypothetical protein
MKVASLVGDKTGATTQYCATADAQSAGILFYQNSGKFAAGGGWVKDPGGHHDINAVAHLTPGSIHIRPHFLFRFPQKTNQNRSFLPPFRRINSSARSRTLPLYGCHPWVNPLENPKKSQNLKLNALFTPPALTCPRTLGSSLLSALFFQELFLVVL